jgi:hypothetical protein
MPQRPLDDRHTGQQPCYLCPSPTTVSCVQCQQPICPDHTKSHRDMDWETLWAGGERVATLWTRYVPTGIPLAVCPACGEALAARDAAEAASDRTAVRQHVLMYLAVACIIVLVILGLNFLLGR